MKTKLFTVILFLVLSALANAQNMTQTLRGTITDLDSQTPLPGATVQIIGSDPVLGAVTDIDGNYRIENVPVGRVSLVVTYVGYEDKAVPNLLVSSAKELIQNVTLKESVNSLAEVVVTAKKDKSEVLNEMALVSARTFSVEETQRYAGALNDPARMVASFAGVNGNAEGNNDIVVRGNSPKGILWRLEGVEIPNPNHFANDGATGGPINALNSSMLDNSDFFTGAFSPEYGNALSGVFDMRFKKGNNEKREYTASASALGLDFTAESPFASGYNGSYIANYRYSSLALLSGLGILDFDGVPKYQDASFNVALPMGKKHVLSVFGLGGISKISQEGTDEEDEDVVTFRGVFDAWMGVTGINHTFFISDRSFIRNSVSVATVGLGSHFEMPEEDDASAFREIENAEMSRITLRAGSTFNHKINARHKVEAGFVYSQLGYNMHTDLWSFEAGRMETLLSEDGSTGTLQAFGSWKYRFGEDWTMTSGLHYYLFALNNSSSVEPRLGIRWDAAPRHFFTAGFGIHSRLETVSAYLSRQYQPDGTVVQPNTELETTKAAHYVLGYGHVINPQTHLKLEGYYQQLYNVPVENEPGSTFSLINMADSYVNRTLVNEGTGRNYGVELTLEQYLHRGFYYMSTVSLYQSKYTAQDGIERNSAFNGNYIVNVLGGKEFAFGAADKGRVLFVNTKVALLGGQRYTPIDLEKSRELGTQMRDETRPFSEKGDDVFFINLGAGIRRNRARTTSEIKLDIANITNHQATVNQYYIEASEKIEKSYQLPILPNIIYTLRF